MGGCGCRPWRTMLRQHQVPLLKIILPYAGLCMHGHGCVCVCVLGEVIKKQHVNRTDLVCTLWALVHESRHVDPVFLMFHVGR